MPSDRLYIFLRRVLDSGPILVLITDTYLLCMMLHVTNVTFIIVYVTL